MLLVNKSGGASAGFVNTQATDPVLDPGLKNFKESPTNGQFIFGMKDVLPESFTAVALGFEQTDAVVRLRKKVLKDGAEDFDDIAIVYYDHNDNIVKAYVLQDGPRGEKFKEVGEQGLYELLKMNNGTLKGAVAELHKRIENYFKPIASRSAVLAAKYALSDCASGVIGNHAVRMAYSAILTSAQKAGIVPSPKFIEIGQQMIAAGITDGDTQVFPEKDENGLISKLIQEWHDHLAANGKANIFIAELQNAIKYWNDNNKKFAADLDAITKKLTSAENLSAQPINTYSPPADTDTKAELIQDKELSASIQQIFDAASDETKVQMLSVLAWMYKSKEKKGFKADAATIATVGKSLAGEAGFARLDVKPIITLRDFGQVTRDNVEAVCKDIQVTFNSGSHAQKTEFIKIIDNYLSSLNDGKYKDDLKQLIEKVDSQNVASRLDMVPVTGKDLVVAPTPSFFETLRNADIERIALSEDNASPAAKDRFGIITDIAAAAGLNDNVIISAAVGGVMATYSPELNTVVLHDSRLTDQYNTFGKFEKFHEMSIFNHARKAFRALAKEKRPITKEMLVGMKMPQDQAETLSKLSFRDQHAAIVKYIGDLTQNYRNGNKKAPKPLISAAALEQFASNSIDDQLKDAKFWGTIIRQERGALYATPQEMMKIDLVEEDRGRPRVKSGAGIPVSIAKQLSRGKNMFGVAPEHHRFSAIRFSKHHGVKKKNYGDDTEIEATGEYVVNTFVTPTKAYYSSVGISIPERMGRHINNLKKCDLTGSYTYEADTDQGRVLQTATVDVTKEIDGLVTILSEVTSRKLGAGLKEAYTSMLDEVTKASQADNRIAEIKKVLFENPNAWVKCIVKAAEGSSSNVYNQRNEAFLYALHQKEFDVAAMRLHNARTTGDWSGSRYIQLSESDKINDQQAAKKTLAKMQYDMSKMLDIAEYGVSLLNQAGLDALKAANKTAVDQTGREFSPVFASPQYNEANDMLALIRDQNNMEVWANRFSKVRANALDPYVSIIRPTEEERKNGVFDDKIVYAADFAGAIKQNVEAFKEEMSTKFKTEKLSEALKANAGSFSTGMSLSALLNASAEGQAIPTAAEIVAKTNETITEVGLPEIDVSDSENPFADAAPEFDFGSETTLAAFAEKPDIDFDAIGAMEPTPLGQDDDLIAMLGGGNADLLGLGFDEDVAFGGENISLLKH